MISVRCRSITPPLLLPPAPAGEVVNLDFLVHNNGLYDSDTSHISIYLQQFFSWRGHRSFRQERGFQKLITAAKLQQRTTIMPVVGHDEVENLCSALRSTASTARRKAIKEILEITDRESNRAAISAMTVSGAG